MTTILLDLCISDGTFDIEAEGDGVVQAHIMQLSQAAFDIWPEAAVKNGSHESSEGWGGFGGGGDREAVRGRPLLLKQLPMTTVPV